MSKAKTFTRWVLEGTCCSKASMTGILTLDFQNCRLKCHRIWNPSGIHIIHINPIFKTVISHQLYLFCHFRTLAERVLLVLKPSACMANLYLCELLWIIECKPTWRLLKHYETLPTPRTMRTNNDKKRSSNVWLNYRRAAKNESAVDADVSI